MAAMEQSLIEQYKDVYVFAQQVDNEISPIAFELLGKAKDLANDLNEKVVAVLIGHNVKDLAAQLGAYGADKVIVVDDKELEVYRTEPYTHALASVINEFKPEIMLVGATAIGRDLGPRVLKITEQLHDCLLVPLLSLVPCLYESIHRTAKTIYRRTKIPQ